MAKGRRTAAGGSSRPFVLLLGGAVLLGATVWYLSADRGPGPEGARTSTPVTAFGDVHGLAVDPGDPSRLFVATHHGLMVGNASGWWRVGEAEDDYMGFTMHPTDSDVLWTSGHPRRGGNIGVQQSTDGGHTWAVLALAGQADFHAMTVSPADPRHLWGTYRGQMHASDDGGSSWDVVDADPPQVLALAADPDDASTVWGAGAAGIVCSMDGGRTWSTLTSTPFQGLGIARDGSILYAVGQAGNAKSVDGGLTWSSVDARFQGTPGHVAVDPTDPDVAYVATYQSAIYRTMDAGGSWTLIKAAA